MTHVVLLGCPRFSSIFRAAAVGSRRNPASLSISFWRCLVRHCATLHVVTPSLLLVLLATYLLKLYLSIYDYLTVRAWSTFGFHGLDFYNLVRAALGRYCKDTTGYLSSTVVPLQHSLASLSRSWSWDHSITAAQSRLPTSTPQCPIAPGLLLVHGQEFWLPTEYTTKTRATR